MVTIEYHLSVTELNSSLVLKLAYLNDLYGVDPFNISRVDEEKESEQEKGGVYVTTVITHKNSFVVDGKPVTVSLTLR